MTNILLRCMISNVVKGTTNMTNMMMDEVFASMRQTLLEVPERVQNKWYTFKELQELAADDLDGTDFLVCALPDECSAEDADFIGIKSKWQLGNFTICEYLEGKMYISTNHHFINTNDTQDKIEFIESNPSHVYLYKPLII